MALKVKGNPINIVPFIDVLLVLFVIMIVAARFDPIPPPAQVVEEKKEGKETKHETEKKIVHETKTQHIPKPTPAVDSKTVEQMQKQIEELKKELKEAQQHKEDHKKDHDHDHNGESMTVTFGPLGLIKIGGAEISEQSLKDIIKITSPGVVWDTRKGGEDTEERMEKFIQANGYSRGKDK